MGKRIKTSWLFAGVGTLLFAGLMVLLVNSTVPRAPGMPITGSMPSSTNQSSTEQSSSASGRMPGMTMPLQMVATRDVHALALLPSGEILFGHHDGVQRFDPARQNWVNLIERANWDAMNLAWDGQRLIVAGHEVYAESPDLKTFRDLGPTGLGGRDIHSYAVSPGDPQRHYLWEARSGLHVSQDAGRNWKAAGGAGLSQGVHSLAVGGDGSVYAVVSGAGLYRSQDRGGRFEPLEAPESKKLTAVSVDAGGTLYAGGAQGLYAREGEGWRRIEQTPVVAMATSPSEAGYAVWIDDTGRVWQR